MEPNAQLSQPNIITDCSKCTFYNNDETCSFDQRYQKFKEQGFAKNDRIENRLCLACRNNEWAEKHKNKSNKELYEIVRNALVPRFCMILDFDSDIYQLDAIINDIKNQIIMPKRVIFVIPYNKKEIIPGLIYELNEQNLDFEWSVKGLEDDINIYSAMDLIVPHDKSHYFGLVKSSDFIPKNFVSCVDNILNEKLGLFSAIVPDGEMCDYFIISREIYMMWGGSITEEGKPQKSIVEKIKEDKQCQAFILKASQIFT